MVLRRPLWSLRSGLFGWGARGWPISGVSRQRCLAACVSPAARLRWGRLWGGGMLLYPTPGGRSGRDGRSGVMFPTPAGSRHLLCNWAVAGCEVRACVG